VAETEAVEFARRDGTQMFVKASKPERVLDIIEGYVAEHGCSGMYEAVDDRVDAHEDRRKERRFALAPPRNGWITVWEDGVWADRRLARRLSEQLETSVRWLMVSSSTDSWAFRAYESGDEVDSAFEEDVDAVEKGEAYAAKEKLPHALRFLGDPNLANVLSGLDVPAVRNLGLDMEDVIAQLPSDAGPKGTVTRSIPCKAS
jgi:hypothetical protein